jgi:hypothetical protein
MARGRRRRTVLPVACWLGVAACSLDFDRYDPDAGTVPGADGGRDGSTDGVAGETATGDAPGDDGMPESSVNPCTAAAGTLDAPQAAGTITIDGDLGDWGSPAFTLLAASDAALIMGPNGTCTAANATSQCLVPNGETIEFALLRDSSNLYFGVRVTVPGVGGTSTTAPYTNDAVEIYLRGDPTATGNYTMVDHQYVIDWQNLVLDYGPSQTDMGQTNPPGVTTAVKVGPSNDSYVVEAKVALTSLGLSSLTPGQKVGLDLGVDHGQGTLATRSFLVWWMSTHAAPTCTTPKCMGCTPDQPYCDTLDFGLLCAD